MSVEQLLNVKFVKAVETYQCIWENTAKGYRDKTLVKEAWEKVSHEINEPAEICRERWRNIRNAFIRSMKRNKNSSNNSLINRKPYYLASYLRFLKPFLKNPNTSDVNSISDTDENTRCSEFEYEEDSKPGPFLDEHNNSIEAAEVFQQLDNVQLETTPHPQTTQKPVDYNVTEEHGNTEQYIEVVEETNSMFFNKRQKVSEDTEAAENDSDSDMSFFKSMLRYVRKMNDKQNRKFRLKVLQALDDAFEEEVELKSPEPEKLQPAESDLRFRKRKQKWN